MNASAEGAQNAPAKNPVPERKPRPILPNKKWLLLILALLLLTFAAGSRYGQYVSGDALPDMTLDIADAAADSAPTEAEQPPHDAAGAMATEIAVHVKGAVADPGLYRFPEGARVDDAVRAAAALPEADLNRLNLAARLSDGGQVIVPYAAAGAGGQSLAERAAETEELLRQVGNPGLEHVIGAAADTLPSASPAAGGGKININTAGLAELKTLNGIGDVKAQAIIAYREQNGAFAYPEQIKRVSGIGDATYRAIADDICVE